ncbi:GbsR/MarR family transcriptional regulator [Pseudonocardia nantongensis]|uniref:GbsR/MarR family transcriptional regulator n=1 Tax=Pseudonocardia nantongensis TaxID=1181885 RepID=UPI003979D678
MADTRTASPAGHAVTEDFATVMGQTMGWPPLAGRTAAALLLSAQPMTTNQLQAETGASGGSISEITRLLISNGVVRRFKQPGTRHFVYEWRADAWAGCLEHQLQQTVELRDLAHRTQALGATLPETQQARLRAMAGYYDFIVVQLTAVLDDYRSRP